MITVSIITFSILQMKKLIYGWDKQLAPGHGTNDKLPTLDSNEASLALLGGLSTHVAKVQGTAESGGICWEKHVGTNESGLDYKKDSD